MEKVFLSLGSNLGDRKKNIISAVELLRKTKEIKIEELSKIIETEPWGNERQPKFKNAVLKIKTGLAPGQLFIIIKGIEKTLGRKPSKIKWGPRVIDIDILLYGKRKIKNRMLEVPHPHMHERLFVLKPFAEISPRTMHPVKKKTIKKLLNEIEQNK